MRASGTGQPAGLAPDTGLHARRVLALRQVARHGKLLRPYDLSNKRETCGRLGADAHGLVAMLELHRLGQDGGLDPAAAGAAVRHLADAIGTTLGRPGRPGMCSHAGGPKTTRAAASLAYALHRYGNDWSEEVRQAVGDAIENSYWPEPLRLHNNDLPIPTAALLAGDALGREKLFARGARQFATIFYTTMRRGGFELNAPLYTAHHFPHLVFLQAVSDPTVRARARILLEFELLASAHLYLPGGGLGAPQSRDYDGGAADGGDRTLLPVLWLFVGDPELEIDLDRASSFLLAAASDYRLPEVIRSIFLRKGDGYDFWVLTDAQQGAMRSPAAVYRLGLGGARGIPWEAVMLPGGRAMMGVSYGWRNARLIVTSGAYVKLPSGDFAILYQYQARGEGDTDDSGSEALTTDEPPEPGDFSGELYDFERMLHHRSRIELWDPLPRPKVKRRYRSTFVHLPRFEALGGQTVRSAGWWVSRVGDTYVAYHPLGKIGVQQPRDGDTWTFLRLDGRSGGITEMATTSDFDSLEAYAADLASRHLVFTTEPLAAEFDALEPTGAKTRIRLEYRPERRFVGGVERSIEQALGHGLMDSPWVTWRPELRQLVVSREGFQTIVYDWARSRIIETTPQRAAAAPDSQGAAAAPRPPELIRPR